MHTYFLVKHRMIALQCQKVSSLFLDGFSRYNFLAVERIGRYYTPFQVQHIH